MSTLLYQCTFFVIYHDSVYVIILCIFIRYVHKYAVSQFSLGLCICELINIYEKKYIHVHVQHISQTLNTTEHCTYNMWIISTVN